MSVVRAALVSLLSLALVVVGAPAAHAEKVSVTGSGSFESLTVNNKGGAVVLKLVAPGGGPCSIRHLAVPLRDRDGTAYRFVAGCYPGSTWAVSLERGQDLVDCDGLTLTYATAASTWKARIPRSCLADLAGTIRAGKSWVDDYSPNVNEAGPTPYVRQSCASDIPSC